jgi:8-amino-7-oxononanoate synthase
MARQRTSSTERPAAAPEELSIEGANREQYEGGGGDIFEKANHFTLPRAARAAKLYPFFQPLDNNDGPEAQIYGRRVIMLGSNNYLGLTRHPHVVSSAAKAIEQYGTSMTGSRFLNGSTHLHEELENRIANFLGKESSLVFTTGYQANLGTVSALVGSDSVAVIDRADHASIYDGCRLADGEMARFRHNDAEHLESTLQRFQGSKSCMVIVDGVFSMGGDLADLPAIVDVCKRYGARLLVDDAHAIGVIGKGGRGTASHFGVEDSVDLIVGTFSKSLASIGGFVAGPRIVMDWIRHFGRAMMFSASLPPASTAAALAALEILEQEPERVDILHENSRTLRSGLRSAGFDVGESQTPIVPINLGDEYKTVVFWKALLEAGVYTNPVTYPAVPKGQGMLRTSCMATHTKDQIEFAIDQFRQVGLKQGLVS